MVRPDNVELLKTLASKTRLSIIDLLLSEPDGLRFSDIAEALKIYPSTLEDHLRLLVDKRMIVHFEDRYIANMSTEAASWIVRSLAPIRDEEFFATHQLTTGDAELKRKLGLLDYEILHDLISILTKAKDVLFQGVKTCFLGGALDMRLEEGFFGLWNPTFEGIDVEVVFTRGGLEALKGLDSPERFMQSMDLSRLQLSVVDECSFAIGGCEKGGLLFLPRHDSKVDFNSCLCFESPAGIDWLRAVFDSLQAQSVKIGVHQLLS
jgi:predicted transcriptional regulator